MTYEELQKYLNDNHFYPGKTVILQQKNDVVDGLFLDIPPILADSRKKRIEELLAGKPFKVTWFPNLQQIHITKIKK